MPQEDDRRADKGVAEGNQNEQAAKIPSLEEGLKFGAFSLGGKRPLKGEEKWNLNIAYDTGDRSVFPLST